MSFVAAVDRDSRLLQVLSAIVVAALLATVVIVLVANHDTGGTLAGGGGVTNPSIHQAPWDTRVFPAAAFGGVTHKDLKAVRAQGKPVTAIVERSLDALVLDPPSAKSVLHKTFSSGAAGEILASHFGAVKGASDLRTTLRVARVGIQASGARAAAAKVRIAYRATVRGHTVRVTEAATLWLQRAHHAWQVVGFQVEQGPQPHNRDHHGSKRSKHGKHE